MLNNSAKQWGQWCEWVQGFVDTEFLNFMLREPVRYCSIICVVVVVSDTVKLSFWEYTHQTR